MKTIFITGGSRGIGKELVYKFGKSGHKIFFTYNHSEIEAKKIVDFFQERSNNNVACFKCDLSVEDDVKSLFKNNKDLFSTIDVLINNAGITNREAQHFLLTRSRDWWLVLNNNLNSVLNCTRNSLPIMIRNKKGRIINITSLSGIKGNPGQSAYAASKAAIVAFSKSLCKELQNTGICINCVAPGFIETDMSKDAPKSYSEARLDNSILKRMGTTEEVCNVINYLAIDAPDYLINQEIIIDGGIA
nr:SDR family NAD(P)-dependent oxidoreductase [Bacteroides coprosuis]